MSHPFPLQKQSLCFLSDLVEHVRVLGFLVPAELCLAANIAPFDLLHVRRAGPTREGRLAEERCTPAQAAPASFEFSGSQSTADCLDLPPKQKNKLHQDVEKQPACRGKLSSKGLCHPVP